MTTAAKPIETDPTLIWDGLHCGDCLDLMQKIPDNYVDLVVTSPPYADARARVYGGIAPDDYVGWFIERAAEIKRIVKPTGSFILNIKEKAVDGERHPYVLDLILALKRELKWCWVEEYIWHKTTSAPGKWKYRFRDSWERILHFSRGKDFKMRQDAVKIPVGDWVETRLRNMGAGDHARHESATRSGIGRRMSAWQDRRLVYPSNVLHRPPICHNSGHSAAFPDWLPDFFIRLLTDSGDVVLDPFVGSGTTFRVAHNLQRVAIGLEIKADYVDKITVENNLL